MEPNNEESLSQASVSSVFEFHVIQIFVTVFEEHFLLLMKYGLSRLNRPNVRLDMSKYANTETGNQHFFFCQIASKYLMFSELHHEYVILFVITLYQH